MDIEARITELVADVEADPPHFGLLSHGEQIAVAAVLTRIDLLKQCGISDLGQVADRLGPDWHRAVLAVRRARSRA